MLDVLRGRELVERGEISLVVDLLVEPADDLLVLCRSHLGSFLSGDVWSVRAHLGVHHERLLTELAPVLREAGRYHPRMSLASLLKKHRLAAGLTQEELAEQAEVSARTISDVERGLRSRIYR